VRLQIGELREGLGAAGVPALVRFVARVRADVLLQVRQLRELALADLAAVRLDPQVDPRVLRQVRGVGKGLAAGAALVGLRLVAVAPTALLLRRGSVAAAPARAAHLLTRRRSTRVILKINKHRYKSIIVKAIF